MKNDLKFKKYIPYEVDFDYLDEKVDFLFSEADANPQKKSFWEIMSHFSENKILEVVDSSYSSGIKVHCERQNYLIECKNLVAREVLSVLLNLQMKNKPVETFWYLSDFDSCNEMPQFIHSFFLADAGNIILDDVTISTSWMDDYDHNVLIESSLIKCHNSSLPLWSNMEQNQNALTYWYYQKFYQETTRGQLLAIRENLSPIFPSSLLNKFLSSEQSISTSPIERRLQWIIMLLGAILIKMLF